MTRSEREALVERLQAANVDSTVEIERRAAAREADPFSAREMMVADARDTHASGDLHYTGPADDEGSPPVRENDAPGGLVYRRYENAPAASPEPDWSPWENWLKAHLDNLREELVDGMAEGMAGYFAQKRLEIDRELAVLRNTNADLRQMLGDTLKRLEQADTKLRNMAADVDGERKDHIGRMTAFQVEVAELRGRMGAILRDFTT